jgi:hypothetical protein
MVRRVLPLSASLLPWAFAACSAFSTEEAPSEAGAEASILTTAPDAMSPSSDADNADAPAPLVLDDHLDDGCVQWTRRIDAELTSLPDGGRDGGAACQVCVVQSGKGYAFRSVSISNALPRYTMAAWVARTSPSSTLVVQLGLGMYGASKELLANHANEVEPAGVWRLGNVVTDRKGDALVGPDAATPVIELMASVELINGDAGAACITFDDVTIRP